MTRKPDLGQGDRKKILGAARKELLTPRQRNRLGKGRGGGPLPLASRAAPSAAAAAGELRGAAGSAAMLHRHQRSPTLGRIDKQIGRVRAGETTRSSSTARGPGRRNNVLLTGRGAAPGKKNLQSSKGGMLKTSYSRQGLRADRGWKKKEHDLVDLPYIVDPRVRGAPLERFCLFLRDETLSFHGGGRRLHRPQVALSTGSILDPLPRSC